MERTDIRLTEQFRSPQGPDREALRAAVAAWLAGALEAPAAREEE